MAQAELAFHHNLPAIMSNRAGWNLETSLIQVVGDGNHPAYGTGSSIVLWIPGLSGVPSDELTFLANDLNSLELGSTRGSTSWVRGVPSLSSRATSETSCFDSSFRRLFFKRRSPTGRD